MVMFCCCLFMLLAYLLINNMAFVASLPKIFGLQVLSSVLLFCRCVWSLLAGHALIERTIQ
ncbi:hypothetical protein V1527DRAFT_461247 [Lipomyces starkeyi]